MHFILFRGSGNSPEIGINGPRPRSEEPAKAGAAMVEFALLLPLLFLMLVGIIEVAFLLSSYVAITNSAREGARVGVSYDTASDAVRTQKVIDAVTSAYDISWPHPMGLASNVGNLDEPDAIQVVYAPDDPTNMSRIGQPITVTVRYRHEMSFGIVPQLPPVVFTATSTMRIE